jgi:hypothetical protein
MRREADVMSICKVIKVIGTSATSWPSPDMREWHVVPWRHREVPVGPARFRDNDEGPVLRGQEDPVARACIRWTVTADKAGRVRRSVSWT